MRPAIEVTDADREAAASIAVLPEMRELILLGRADHHAEPFARHRLAEREAVVKWLREIEKPNGRKCHHWSLATALEAGEHLK